MAHIRKFRKKWQAIIRRKGIKTITKSFVLKAECSRWAKQIEVKLDQDDKSIINFHLFFIYPKTEKLESLLIFLFRE